MFTKKLTCSTQKKIIKAFSQFKGFEILRLKDFLKKFPNEINSQDLTHKMKRVNYNCPYEIFCLTDCRNDVRSTMNHSTRKKYRKVNTKRRRRMKNQYHYTNVFNRIHGYLILHDMTGSKNIPHDKKVTSLSLICSSPFSDKKGIGSCLMKFMKEICSKSDFTDIVLEVANEFASECYDSDDETDYEEYYESDDEEILTEREIYNQEIVDFITDEFSRKSLRHRIGEDGLKEAYYNVGDEYIYSILYSYINDIYEKYEEDEEDEYDREYDIKNPDADQYGGYYYQKGKLSQIGLYQFYQKFGFREMPEIHYKWKIYTSCPLPTMILSL